MLWSDWCVLWLVPVKLYFLWLVYKYGDFLLTSFCVVTCCWLFCVLSLLQASAWRAKRKWRVRVKLVKPWAISTTPSVSRAAPVVSHSSHYARVCSELMREKERERRCWGGGGAWGRPKTLRWNEGKVKVLDAQRWQEEAFWQSRALQMTAKRVDSFQCSPFCISGCCDCVV